MSFWDAFAHHTSPEGWRQLRQRGAREIKNRESEKDAPVNPFLDLDYYLELDDLMEPSAKIDWMEKFNTQPEAFFESEFLASEKMQVPAYRLAMLARSCLHLVINSGHTETYFSTYPEDLPVLVEYYIRNNGRFSMGIEHHLYTTIGYQILPFLKPYIPNFDELSQGEYGSQFHYSRFRQLGQHLDSSERNNKSELTPIAKTLAVIPWSAISTPPLFLPKS